MSPLTRRARASFSAETMLWAQWFRLKTKNFELFNPDCKFTDDTVMTVAVAEACMNEEPYVDSMQAWGRKYPFAGYGSWFGQWIFSENPEPYNSFGNGSAMRVSSIGWLFDKKKWYFRRPLRLLKSPIIMKKES